MGNSLPSTEYLRARLHYDAETGRLVWRARPDEQFPTLRAARAWNSRYSGNEALYSPMANGYLHGSIDNKRYLAHRVIWKIVTGVEPDEVDHIDGDRGNNRFANLRSISHAENGRNAGRPIHNTSGVTGVSYEKRARRWVAHITAHGIYRFLGSYISMEDAAAARRAAEAKYGFHKNHGTRLSFNSASSTVNAQLRVGEQGP